LLILGARSRLNQVRVHGTDDPWLRDLLARRPIKVVVVALAAKMARVIWALLATGQRYRTAQQRAQVAVGA
jgi:transposase